MDERSALRKAMTKNRNLGFMPRTLYAHFVNQSPSKARSHAAVFSDQVLDWYREAFAGIDGAELAVQHAVARDRRNGLMTAMGHRVAMESLPMLLSEVAEPFALLMDPALLSEKRYIGERNREYEGIEAVLVKHQFESQFPAVVRGLLTFGRDLEELSDVFADATKGLKDATSNLLDHLMGDRWRDEEFRRSPLTNKRFPADIRRFVGMLNVSDVPAISITNAQRSGTEIAVSAVIDARRALCETGCTEAQTYATLLLDLDVLDAVSRLADLTADERHVRRRYDGLRKPPFVAKWSTEKNRYVLEWAYRYVTPEHKGRGVCAASDALHTVDERHSDFVCDANEAFASTLSPIPWQPRMTFNAPQVSMLTSAVVTHALASAEQFVFPELRYERDLAS